ncbi:MAG: hypothetical protein IJ588_12555 [Prevotella sp.]|nr:hypothetical protein [Prevotella sp.]
MAMKTKKQLKDVFGGIASMWYQSAELDLSSLEGITITPEYDVPVKVDTIELEQGDPSIEHYKVIGLPGDWITSSEAGDIDLSFRVPTKHSDILKLAYGADAVKAITGATVDGVTYNGTALTLADRKIDGTFILVNQSKDKLLVLANTSLWAKPVIDSDAKGVFALDFNGTIESDGTTPDILFLEKAATTGGGE